MLRIVPEITQNWSVADIVRQRTPSTWEPAFEASRDELADISDILAEDEKTHGRYYPDKKDLFRALEMVPLSHVRVVIIGQDPYPDTNAADPNQPRGNGMAFSQHANDTISSSLRTVFRELKKTIPNYPDPQCGDLTYWAIQGVLLLNKSLTVRPGQPGSHERLWDKLVEEIIKLVVRTNPKVMFALWGAKARGLRPIIGNRNPIIEAAHPSGRAAGAYAGSDNFNKINQYLQSIGQTPIDWRVMC